MGSNQKEEKVSELSEQQKSQYEQELVEAVKQFQKQYSCSFTIRDQFWTDDGGLHADGQVQGIESDPDFADIREKLSEETTKGIIVHNFSFEYYPEGHPDNREYVMMRANGILEVRDGSEQSDYYDLSFALDLEEGEWGDPSIAEN